MAGESAEKNAEKRVFLIHGRNLRAVKDLKKTIDNWGYRTETFQDVRGGLAGGATIQEIIKRGLQGVAAAVVFMSPDQLTFIDPVLRESEHELARWEARPNVMFEAGMAYEQAANKMILVALRGVLLPSDLAGLDVIYFDDPQGKDVLKLRLAATARGEASRIPPPPENAAEPRHAAKLRFADAFLTDLMERLKERHLGSAADVSAADVLRGTAPIHADWRGQSSKTLMTEISKRYRNDVTDDAYWWFCVDGVLAFNDKDDWLSEGSPNPTWRSSAPCSHISATGGLLLNLISAGYFGEPRLAPELPSRRRSEGAGRRNRPAP
jgi:hypothetical protein